MKKININGITQDMSAEEINAVALDIIHRKGQVDFTGTNIIITPPRNMRAFMAGIIVKCAQENNGVVKISGHETISDAVWDVLKNGKPAWMLQAKLKYDISIDNLLIAYSEWNNLQYAFQANDDGNYGYLVSNDSAYIDTGLLQKCNEGFVIKGKLSYNGDFSGIYGSAKQQSETGPYLALVNIYWNNEHQMCLHIKSTSGPSQWNNSWGELHEYKVDSGKLYFDGTFVTTQAVENLVTNEPAYIYQTNGYTKYASQKILLVCQLDSSGNTVSAFVPFYRNGEYGMLNLMADDITADSAFFTNASSSGSFTYQFE